nr:recombinase family protein [Nonomuraea ceibae]
MALIGLVRVSTDRQNTPRQHDALDPICLKVFEEKISDKLATDDRPALLSALPHLRDGDLLTVQEADRLGRNLLEGLIVLNDLLQRGVGVKVLEGIAAGEHIERSLILDLALALAEVRRLDITRKTNGLEAARKGGRSAAAVLWSTTTNAPPFSPGASAANPSVPSPPESKSPSASSTRPSRSPALMTTPGSCRQRVPSWASCWRGLGQGQGVRVIERDPTARKRYCDQDPSHRQRLSGGSSPP